MNGRVDRVVGWWVRRSLQSQGIDAGSRGRLVWVDADARVWDLGDVTPRELTGIVWGFETARASSRSVGERARLSKYSRVARGLGLRAQKVYKSLEQTSK